MKLVRIRHRDLEAFGVLSDDMVLIGERSYAPGEEPSPGQMDKIFQELLKGETLEEAIPISEVTLLPPLTQRSKMFCLGMNYKGHIDELKKDIPEDPALFVKFPDALVGQGQPILRPRVSEQFDFEGEIAVVIGKKGRHISRENALEHVLGYSILMDGSIRDYQGHSISAGKNFWRSGSFGPWIVTADEIGDLSELSLETRLSGQIVQSATADLMLYDIPTAIEYISRWIVLTPGDVIATGTPAGVGARRDPKLWMKPGDTIEVEVTSIGVLSNPVIDET